MWRKLDKLTARQLAREKKKRLKQKRMTTMFHSIFIIRNAFLICVCIESVPVHGSYSFCRTICLTECWRNKFHTNPNKIFEPFFSLFATLYAVFIFLSLPSSGICLICRTHWHIVTSNWIDKFASFASLPFYLSHFQFIIRLKWKKRIDKRMTNIYDGWYSNIDITHKKRMVKLAKNASSMIG